MKRRDRVSAAAVLAILLILFVSHSHTATPGPTISILSPAEGKTVYTTGTTAYPVRVIFSAWDNDGTGSITNYQFSSNGGSTWSSISPVNYGLSDNKIYRYYDWVPASTGNYTLQISATDGTNTGRSRKVQVSVRVASLTNFSSLPGDGTLLVRDNDNTICLSCHNLRSHSSADTGSTKYGNWERVCRDCHTPHNTKNIFLLQSSFKVYTGTNQIYAYNRKVDFRNLSGESSYGHVSQTPAPGSARRGPCEVCHTKTVNSDGTPRWRNNTSIPDMEGVQFVSGLPKHNSGTNCTGCHKHTEGFAGKESTGNQMCSGCHAGLFTVMSTGNNLYHHYMNNSEVTTLSSGSKYPVTTSVMGISYGNANRRCLMCHVDHDIFADAGSPQKRAGNLRKSIRALPTAATAQRTDFINETSTSQGIWGGLCLSCHRKAQQKYTTMLGKDGSKQTPIIPFPGGTPYDYTQTVHGTYTVPATFKADGSTFKANCMKCHNDALKKTKQTGDGLNAFGTRTSSFGTHGAPVRRMQALMGNDYELGKATGFDTASTIIDTTKGWTDGQWVGRTVSITFGKGANQGRTIAWNSTNRLGLDRPWTVNPDNTSKYNIGDPIEEDLCFRCHSNNTEFNPYTARDYYGKKKFSNMRAKKVHQIFTDGWPTPPLTGKVASGSTTLTIIAQGTPNWTTNQWAGYLVLMKSGRNLGRSQTITSNTANSVTLRRNLRYTPAVGDRFVIQKYGYRHQIDAYVGKHRTDEYFDAEDGPTKTPAGWYGADQHVGCSDCHNPHGARAQGITNGYADTVFTTPSSITDTSKTGANAWPVNRWKGYVVRVVDDNYTSLVGQSRIIQSNTGNRLQLAGVFLAGNNSPKAPLGVHYAVTPTGRPPTSVTGTDDEGNDINNANYGVWGVNVNFDNITAAPLATSTNRHAHPIEKNPVFTKMAAATKVYQICLKCHSDYGWGNNGPRMEIPDSIGASSGTFDNGTSTNIAREFNPNNLSHHAVLAPGNNQPISVSKYLSKASGGTTLKLFDNTAGWTPGQWVGKYMTVTKGASVGSSKAITYNTATSIGWSGALGTAPNSTSYYAIGVDSYLNPNWPYFKSGVSINTSGLAVFKNDIPSTAIPGWYLYAGGKTRPPGGTISGSNAFTGWFQVKSVLSNHTAFVTPAPAVAFNNFSGHLTAGLGNNFVPPYGPWSVISCADCHGSERDEPAGPHASTRMWIRRDLDTRISFDWMNGTNGSGTVTRINYYSLGFGSSDLINLCINCHRSDVYGQQGSFSNTPYASMARISHRSMWNNDDRIATSNPTWGIVCMNCHGGDAMGSIHGSNAGKGASGTSYRGRRLMNGAAWDGYTRSATSLATCYSTRANSSVSTCNQGADGAGITMNYGYTGGADGRTVP